MIFGFLAVTIHFFAIPALCCVGNNDMFAGIYCLSFFLFVVCILSLQKRRGKVSTARDNCAMDGTVFRLVSLLFTSPRPGATPAAARSGTIAPVLPLYAINHETISTKS